MKERKKEREGTLTQLAFVWNTMLLKYSQPHLKVHQKVECNTERVATTKNKQQEKSDERCTSTRASYFFSHTERWFVSALVLKVIRTSVVHGRNVKRSHSVSITFTIFPLTFLCFRSLSIASSCIRNVLALLFQVRVDQCLSVTLSERSWFIQTGPRCKTTVR